MQVTLDKRHKLCKNIIDVKCTRITHGMSRMVQAERKMWPDDYSRDYQKCTKVDPNRW
uniref:Uncharacterized protein n=1 Tax=Arion vulgaris TaxID=1028688 RepID=A0A0B6ZDU4_9EUPU